MSDRTQTAQSMMYIVKSVDVSQSVLAFLTWLISSDKLIRSYKAFSCTW